MAGRIRILSIDGGGVRGIIPAVILKKLEDKLRETDPQGRIGDYFDLFAGTSTGGIIISGLLAPGRDKYEKWRYSAADLIDFYRLRGPEIFDRNWMQRLKTGFGLRQSKYPAHGIENALNDYFGNMTLSALHKPTLIPAYDVESKSAQFFTQHDAVKDFSQDFYLQDVIRATAAAPTYFDAATIYSLEDFRYRRRYTLIDGGVFANNPALCAYAEARAHPDFRKQLRRPVSAAQIYMLSLGTGFSKAVYTPEQVRNWGLIKWSRPLIGIMMDGVAETVDYQLKQVFGSVDSDDNYIRIESKLPSNISAGMDDASPDNIRALIDFGYELAESDGIVKKLSEVAEQIRKNR